MWSSGYWGLSPFTPRSVPSEAQIKNAWAGPSINLSASAVIAGATLSTSPGGMFTFYGMGIVFDSPGFGATYAQTEPVGRGFGWDHLDDGTLGVDMNMAISAHYTQESDSCECACGQ
jgi:hypothetical protein